MEISDVRIRIVNGAGKLKAAASVTLDHCFAVHDIKVLEGSKGLFITMPSRKSGKGEFKDIAHPLDSATRELLKEKILSAYQTAISSPSAICE